MIPDGDGGSTMTTPEEAKVIMGKEKHELVPQLRFPPGYHFVPTELELLDVYLRGKIEGRKPPLDIFMDVNLLEFEPGKLIAERKAYGEDTYFFFTVREEWPSNRDNQPRRKLHEVRASWKATGSVAKIYRPGTVEVVGTKRMLTYSSGRPNHDKYSMYEYVLESKSQMDQWVLCTIQEKQNWNANRDKDENTGSGKDKKAGVGKDMKRKRGTETCVKPKTTKRKKKKKTATSQPQETQEQQQQEITSAISSNPPPLLGHDEQVDHHQALHEEGVMAFEETSPAIQVVAPHHEYPDGDQPYYHDTSMQEETTAWDRPGQPPLMTHQQQGYQASSMEEQQFDILGAQYMSEYQFSTMAQVYPDYLMFQYQEEQQPLPPHRTYEYELLQQQIQHWLGTQGFHRDIVGTLQDAQQFLQESGKPPHTSPDSVLGGPDPGLPSENAYAYSDSDAGMMNGVASTVATGYGSAADHEFNPVDFVGHDFDYNLAGNGGGSHVAMELPDHGSNQALHTCQHGVQWRCGEHQGVDMESCFRCVTSCELYHST